MSRAWRTTWLLLAFMLVNFADKAVLGLAGPEIRADFGITRQEFGTAQSAFFALFSLAALVVSALTRRVRTATLLLVLALLWSVAQLPMLWGAAGFGTLLATRVLLGAAEGPASPSPCTTSTAGSRSVSGPCPPRFCWSARRPEWPSPRRCSPG